MIGVKRVAVFVVVDDNQACVSNVRRVTACEKNTSTSELTPSLQMVELSSAWLPTETFRTISTVLSGDCMKKHIGKHFECIRCFPGRQSHYNYECLAAVPIDPSHIGNTRGLQNTQQFEGGRAIKYNILLLTELMHWKRFITAQTKVGNHNAGWRIARAKTE